MRLPHESLDELNDETRGVGVARAVGRASRQRAARTSRGLHVQRSLRRAVAAGRVLLAGDAAHHMPPFAGQGMCAGVRDAANLAWKLDLVLAGRAADALLDSYETERLPSARAAIEFSMELGKVICVPDPDEAAARDEAMAAAVGDEPTDAPALPGIDVRAHPPDRAARRARSSSRARRRRPAFDDVHGAGWRLVTVDADVERIDPDARALVRLDRRARRRARRSRSDVRAAGSPSTTRRARCSVPTSISTAPPRRPPSAHLDDLRRPRATILAEGNVA